MMDSTIYVNGRIMPARAAHISALDRGFTPDQVWRGV